MGPWYRKSAREDNTRMERGRQPSPVDRQPRGVRFLTNGGEMHSGIV